MGYGGPKSTPHHKVDSLWVLNLKLIALLLNLHLDTRIDALHFYPKQEFPCLTWHSQCVKHIVYRTVTKLGDVVSKYGVSRSETTLN